MLGVLLFWAWGWGCEKEERQLFAATGHVDVQGLQADRPVAIAVSAAMTLPLAQMVIFKEQ